MARLLVFTALLVSLSFPVMAEDKFRYTSDPNHRGTIAGSPAGWTPTKTSCSKCQGLVDAYNNSMQQLMNARHELSELSDDVHDQKFDLNYFKQSIEQRMGGEKGLTPHLEQAVAHAAETKAAYDDMKKNDLPRLEQAVKNLEYSTKDLRTQIAECEKQCDTSETDKELGALGVPSDFQTIQLPFDWRGPYDAVCDNCAKLALRLNALPGAALKNLAELDAAEAELSVAEVSVKRIKSYAPFYQHSDKAKDYILKRLEGAQQKVEDIQIKIKRLRNDYEEYKKSFKETLKLYNDCIKTCKGGEPPKDGKEACVFPENRPAISIGPNDEVGTGKALTDKVTGQAKGMAMGALGGLMGGSGVSMGGGGGGDQPGSPMGGGSQEPTLDKDPTSGPFTTVSAGGTDLAVRSGMNNEGFVVSAEIKDSPGDGTFHAMWLEDGQGNIILPRRYLLIDIYRNWKLSVWWDYKRWRDNELVEHRSGDSMTVGTDYLGTIALFEGAKGIAKSIWNSFGFGAAVKGAKHIGAIFPASAVQGPCSPLKLVVHISLPKQDPVPTQVVVVDMDTRAIANASPTSAKTPASKKSSGGADSSRDGESKGGKRVRERANSQNQ